MGEHDQQSHAGEGGGAGDSGGNVMETREQMSEEKDNLKNKGQGINAAIVNGKDLRNGNVLSVNKKIYKITSTSASDKFTAREVTSINIDRTFATGGNDNFLSLSYDGEYLKVNEKELVNFFKPLPK